MINLHLSISEFLTSPQEIVLVSRHGKKNEEDQHHRNLQASLYRVMCNGFGNHLLDLNLQISIPNRISIELHTGRFYHHRGYIRRLFFFGKEAAEVRSIEAKERDILGIQLAGWIASRVYQENPHGLQLMYHIVQEEKVVKSTIVPVPFPNPQTVQEMVYKRLLSLADAFDLKEENLPACSRNERLVTPGAAWSKCMDFCRARHVCHQYLDFKNRSSAALPSPVSV